MATVGDLNCREFVELVTEYLEGTMSPGERTRFEAHLGTCEDCTVYLEQMRQTIRLLGRLNEGDVPPDGRDRLLAAFRDWKRR